MEFFGQTTEFFSRLIDSADDLTIFLFVALIEIGPAVVLPDDVIKIMAGYRVAQGRANLLWTLLLFESATLLGASILYWIAARGGRPLMYRSAEIFRVDRDKLDRLEDWVQRRGVLAVLIGRIIPGPRIPVVFIAGVLGLPYLKLLPALAVGSMGFILPWVLLGMWAGPQALTMVGQIELPARAVATVVLFVTVSAAMVAVYRRARARATPTWQPMSVGRRIETALLAGCLATFEMILGVNVALLVLGLLRVTGPEQALLRLVERGAPLFTEGSTPRFFMHLTFVLILGSLGCAVVYAFADSILPGPAWLRGLLFAPLPLLVSQLAVMPWLGVGPFGLGLEAGWVPVVGEVLRNALFGVSLGITFALLREARQRLRDAGGLEVAEEAG